MENSVINSIVSNHNGWDEGEECGDIQLYDATLAIDTKKFKKGDKISAIAFMLSKSTCKIYATEDDANNVKVSEKFKLKLIPVFE